MSAKKQACKSGTRGVLACLGFIVAMIFLVVTI